MIAFIIVGGMITFVVVMALWPKLVAWNNARYWELPTCSGVSQQFGMGETIVADFRRAAKKRSYLDGHTITAELTCTEWVRYRSGTDTVTKQEVVRSVPGHVEPVADDEAAAARVTVVIPQDAPATFSLKDNRILWSLRIQLDSPTAADPKHDYSITVAPRVVSHG